MTSAIVNGLAGVAGFSPASLFASGEQGAWYDPSDLSSIFQDSAGSIAAVVGQPVGLMLDKRFGLARSAEGWSNTAPTVNGEASIVSPGVFRIFSSAGVFCSIQCSAASLVVGKWYEVTVTVDSITTLGGGVTCTAVAAVQLTSTGTKRFIGQATATNMDMKRAGGVTDIQISNVSFKEIAGNHALQATTAQKPILRLTSGKYYLEFDGVDDGMATASASFAAADKMSIWAGAYAAASGTNTLVELSADVTVNTGAFYITMFESTTVLGFRASNGATNRGYNSAAKAAATLYTLSSMLDGAAGSVAASVIPRINGTIDQTTLSGAVAAGNFAAYPLYIGRRAGATQPFNGRIYQMIIRGVASSAGDIASTETYVNGKTGAY